MLQLTKNSIAKSINISKIISTQQNRTLCTAHLSQSTQVQFNIVSKCSSLK